MADSAQNSVRTLAGARLARLLYLCAAPALLCVCAGPVAAQEGAAALYVRVDSDDTTVITPRLRVATPLDDATRAELVYTVDVWTSASIDIRTSASVAIPKQHEAVTEQRDEIDLGLSRELGDARLSAGYRYSTEPDYLSHGGSLGFELDLADKAATLASSVSAGFDEVGRVGDPFFWRSLRTLGARAAFTQVLDPDSLVQLAYEVSRAEGFLSSPYRSVGIGSEDGSCRGEQVLYCVPEHNPGARLRHAFLLQGRRALAPGLSLGASYRYYLDDWELDSHTLQADVALFVASETLLGLRYRFYTQSAASHYRTHYPELTKAQLYTRDKELSALHAHRAALELDQRWPLEQQALRLLLSAGPTLYEYRNFLPLDHITVFEVTLTLGYER